GEPRNGGDANAIAGAPRGRTGSDRFEPSEARQTERPAAIAREMGRQAASTSGGTGLDLQPATAKDGRSLELLRPPGNESGEGWEERMTDNTLDYVLSPGEAALDPEQAPESGKQRLRIHIPNVRTTLTMGAKAQAEAVRGGDLGPI